MNGLSYETELTTCINIYFYQPVFVELITASTKTKDSPYLPLNLLSTIQVLFLFGCEELHMSVVHEKNSFINRIYICPNFLFCFDINFYSVCNQVLKNTWRFSIGESAHSINHFIILKQAKNFEKFGRTISWLRSPGVPLTMLHVWRLVTRGHGTSPHSSWFCNEFLIFIRYIIRSIIVEKKNWSKIVVINTTVSLKITFWDPQ